MAQNIYDDPEFFAAYAQLPRSIDGLDGAPEWPALRAMLPDVNGAHVVDLGCGLGWFCRWVVGAGAASVLGVDLSARMLAGAAARTDDPRITYERHDLDALDLGAASFELAYSSLTLHYLTDLGRFLASVRRALVRGGTFVFSAEHPIYTAPSEPGFVTSAAGRVVWPLDQYLDEGARRTDWLAPGVLKHHRTVATYLSELRRAGLELTDLVEWGPTAEQIADVPAWAPERQRPMFLLARADAT